MLLVSLYGLPWLILAIQFELIFTVDRHLHPFEHRFPPNRNPTQRKGK